MTMEKWNAEQPREVDVLMGASMLLRKAVLDKVGLLDEGYFMYSEEVDLCFRLQKAGWQLYWVPQSQVVHYWGQSAKQVLAEMFLQLYRGKLRFFRKHYSWLTVSLYKVVLGCGSFVVAGLGTTWFGCENRISEINSCIWRGITAVFSLPSPKCKVNGHSLVNGYQQAH